MIVLYRIENELYRSEVRDASDVRLKQGVHGAWVLSIRTSGIDVGSNSINGTVVHIAFTSQQQAEAAIRKMCENVRFVDLTKFQEG